LDDVTQKTKWRYHVQPAGDGFAVSSFSGNYNSLGKKPDSFIIKGVTDATFADFEGTSVMFNVSNDLFGVSSDAFIKTKNKNKYTFKYDDVIKFTMAIDFDKGTWLYTRDYENSVIANQFGTIELNMAIGEKSDSEIFQPLQKTKFFYHP